jgi:hypothetical protein
MAKLCSVCRVFSFCNTSAATSLFCPQESTRIIVPSIMPTMYFLVDAHEEPFLPLTVPQPVGLVHGSDCSLYPLKTKANSAGKWRQSLIVPANDRNRPSTGRMRETTSQSLTVLAAPVLLERPKWIPSNVADARRRRMESSLCKSVAVTSVFPKSIA